MLPDGWVEVIVAYELDPGWHAIAPRSAHGPRVQLALELPKGAKLSGRLRSPEGKAAQDASFGDVRVLEGKGELRQRFRVPADASGKQLFGGSTTWVVCDAQKCLPPQTLNFELKVGAGPRGGRGPIVASPPPGFEPTEHELEILRTRGFVARAWPETEVVTPGEELLIAVDFMLAEDVVEQRLYVQPAEDNPLVPGGIDMAGPGWRTYTGPADARQPQGRKLFREVIPLVVNPAVEGNRAGYALLATLTMKKAGASAIATQEVRVEFPVGR